MRSYLERRRDRYTSFAQRLQASLAANIAAARTRIARQNERVATFAGRAARAVDVVLDRHTARLDRAAGLLAAYSYRGVLERGFALVRDAGGHPLRAAASVTTGMRIDIEFSDGRVGAIAGDARMTPPAETAPVSARRRRRRPDGGEGQGSLF